MISIPLNVVKIGGSLFDHPSLGMGLRKWLTDKPPLRYLFIPGGGALAEVVRDYHRIHGVSEEDCHWMAIQAMSVNMALIKSMLPEAHEIHHPVYWPGAGGLGVLNAWHFIRDDEANSDALAHDWRVTSDAISARVAEIGKVSKLIMLKSVDLPAGISWSQAADQGFVDPTFGQVVGRARLPVEWVNYRRFLDALG
jgi:5-(aminomethyl)-3-furanmethanol phosphate kinase